MNALSTKPTNKANDATSGRTARRNSQARMFRKLLRVDTHVDAEIPNGFFGFLLRPSEIRVETYTEK